MRKFKVSALLFVPFFLVVVGSAFGAPNVRRFEDYLGPQFSPVQLKAVRLASPSISPTATETIARWNQIAIDASGLDHTPVAAGDPRIFGEQLGRARASRAIAIVHIAIFDSVNGILGGYKSYTNIAPAKNASVNAAVAQAAYETLAVMFPSQQAAFAQALSDDLNKIGAGAAKTDGIDLGHRAAAAILAMRANDGSSLAEPRLGLEFFTSNDAGKWRQDPISQSPVALGALWNQVTPFVMQTATQFRAPPPPSITSAVYAAAYNEAKLYGGDGVNTPTIRTQDQTETGFFWAYDGTPSLCAPPRMYNEITMKIAQQKGTIQSPLELARLLALVNVSLADTGIAVWDSKFFYQFWRPITGIRESDPGTGPSGTGDGNPNTIGDPTFHPLGAPATNLTGPNFTPPFPSYPSGHGGFGGALFETLRNYYHADDVAFTFTSDEFNGTTIDNLGQVRPLKPRSFTSFSQAEEENGQSRIYLGIHWSFDKTAAISQGRKVADFVYQNAFTGAQSCLLNVSTRMRVLTGDRVLIGGFIITGTDPKKIAIRAIGPSLSNTGLTGLLDDPVLELHAADGSVLATNDNWQTTAGASDLTANGIAPTNDKEAALVQTLPPGTYTAIVRGQNNASGIGLIELYDFTQTSNSLLANISTRGFVDTGDKALIGGFIVGSGSSGRVAVRALGPSLSTAGISGTLSDPILELHDTNGALLKSN
ncbi:MAG TPA: vanadium-dependent haloperoxidase, partial [Chthoniobacterales bacterium]|nr:vanadium-dependent haloperoxidase [Chthoniobacterales bacterium]